MASNISTGMAVSNNQSIIQLNASIASADNLAFLGILRPSCQAFRFGPNIGCSCSHVFSHGDPLGAAQAANNKKGVVGNKGSRTPAAPSPRQLQVVSVQARRTVMAYWL